MKAGTKQHKQIETSRGYKESFIDLGDLFQLYQRFDAKGLEAMASFAGYSVKRREIKAKKTDHDHMSLPEKAGILRQEPRLPEEEKESLSFLRVRTLRKKKPEERVTLAPKEFIEADEFTIEETECKGDLTVPQAPALFIWSRIWPFLREILGSTYNTTEIDIPTTIRIIAECRPFDRFPLVKRKAWAPVCQILLDYDERMIPFYGDLYGLMKQIRHVRGKSGLEVLILENGPYHTMRNFHKPRHFSSYKTPEPGTPIVVISDLGCFDTTGNARDEWIHFGRSLYKKGFCPVALAPLSPGMLDKELLHYWDVLLLNRNKKPKFYISSGGGKVSHEHAVMVNTLLSLLSVAIRVETGLLRKVRILLGPRADAGVEGAVWNHGAVERTILGFAFKTGASLAFRKESDNQQENPSFITLQKETNQLISQFHESLSPMILMEEKANWGVIEGDWWKAAKTLSEKNYPGFISWFFRVKDRLSPGMLSNYVLGAAWVITHKEEILKNKRLALPPGLDLNAYEWILQRDRKIETTYQLYQLAQELVISAHHTINTPLYSFTTINPDIQISSLLKKDAAIPESSKTGETTHLNQMLEKEAAIKLEGNKDIRLSTEKAVIEIDAISKPEWAATIGRDKNGLFVTYKKEGEIKTLYWSDPRTVLYCGDDMDFYFNKGFFWNAPDYLYFKENGFPDIPWATHHGIDEYGLRATVTIKNVSFRVRWIKPGEFAMGSPEDEPERDDDETLHTVILTKGYWMAETACTQELWEVVMGSNPSEFKGAFKKGFSKGFDTSKNLPVEKVSWEDCGKFIEKLNNLIPGLDIRLPTEAEWEYACRAGTSTPFCFGDNITTNQVNYNGNNPYNKGKKGEYRGKIVGVYELPCNAWGLYQMHGNVWEWCEDWFGDYDTGIAIDPLRTDKGDYRVIRGGCWFDFAGNTRSANRYWFRPSYRAYDVGFRLARGH